jgi:Protein of unknown function (DUF2530)
MRGPRTRGTNLGYVSEQAEPASPEVSPGSPAETAATPTDPAELLGARAGLRPAPPPLEVDTFRLVLVGIALWAVAFLALLPVRHEHREWLEICVAGFGLGLIGLVLSRNRRFRRGQPR